MTFAKPTASGQYSGVSSAQAQRLLSELGFNELPSARPKSLFAIFLRVIREPMLLLLVACALIYASIGEIQDGAILFVSVFIVVGLTLYQEKKSDRAIEALKDLSSPRALVVRDGQERRIPGREVVPGDLIVVKEGDRIPADSVLLTSRHLKVDESLLTGEAFPVQKKASPSGSETKEALLYSGTLVVAGQGSAKVLKTGIHTEMGKIGRSLREPAHEQTLLQREIGKLAKKFGVAGLGFSALITVTYGLTRGDWPKGFLAGIAAAMSLLPEEFPVVLTVFLAVGAWRISKRNVLARQVSAVEALGSISALCVDKTGTLTMNKMIVRQLDVLSGRFDLSKSDAELPEEFHSLVEYGVLASQIDPFDPMERAIHQTLYQKLSGTEHVHKDWILVHEYPLSDELLAMSCVWRSGESSAYIIASKGAPEAIIDLCHLEGERKNGVLRRVQSLSEEGLRVLGVAKASFDESRLPPHPHHFDFGFLGLIALEDPVKPNVKASIEECDRAGIRVIMMTGDYSGTAKSIARQIQMKSPEQVMLGEELEKLSEQDLQERIKTIHIFARMVPHAKLRIINALKANGEVVAMTGDGVNDAPSLKWADIGVAMGGRGTDVARESSDLVLLDDDFSSIVAAVRLGRRIFDNIKKAMGFILAVHVPIAGMAMLPVLLNMPLVLFPAHIVFLELIIDPACALVFEVEPEESGIMSRPPRDLNTPLFGRLDFLRAAVQGAALLAVVFSMFLGALEFGKSEPISRTIAFATLVLCNLGLILVSRSRSRSLLKILAVRNRTFYWILCGAILLLFAAIYLPFLQRAFGFGALGVMEAGVCLIAAIVATLIVQQLKRIDSAMA